MATKTLKAQVKLDGEAEYKRAIAELGRDNAVLTSEMKKLTAEYQGNTKSAEYLTKRGEILADQLATQQAKVRETQAAYNKAREALDQLSGSSAENAEAFEAAQAKLAEWQIKLNNAETAQYNLEHAIDDNNQALQDQQNELDDENGKLVGLGDAVDGLAGKLGIQLPDQAKEALNGMVSFSEGTALKMTAVAGAVAAVVEVVKLLHSTTLEAAAAADDLLTQSTVYNVPLTRLQQWQYAAGLVDVSASSMVSALQKVTKSMYDADQGGEKTAAAFAQLGVAIHDEANGELRDSEDVLQDVLRGLSEMQNQTEQDAVAMQLLGKSAMEFNPILADLDNAQRIYNEAVANGYVLSDEQLKKLGEVDDAFQRQTLTVDAAKKKLALEFAPASTAAMELFAESVDKASTTLAESGIITDLAAILTAMIDIGSQLSSFNDAIPDFLSPLSQFSGALDAAAVAANFLSDSLRALMALSPASLISSTWTGDWSNIKSSLSFDNTRKVINSRFGHNASGSNSWRGGLTWVGEAGPELVDLPEGTRIYNNQETRLMGGDSIVINCNVRDLEDLGRLIRWAKSQKMSSRMAGKEPVYGN